VVPQSGWNVYTVCLWIGNSSLIAAKHYLQVTDADFDRAIRPARPIPENPPQNPPQQIAESAVIDRKAKELPILQIARNADGYLGISVPPSQFPSFSGNGVGVEGLGPSTLRV
jgi:hypothetical protein